MGEIMENKDSLKIFDKTPLIAWIHNISKNQIKYLKSRISELDLDFEIRYIMMVYENQNCSQEDLVNTYGESKANIAKALRKLETKGYVERKINPNNRRKYMLKTTPKANEIIPKIKQISHDWEKEVGMTEDDYKLKERLREIAINGMDLVKEL